DGGSASREVRDHGGDREGSRLSPRSGPTRLDARVATDTRTRDMGAVAGVLDLRALLELRTASPADLEGELALVRCDLPGTMQLFRTPLRGGELEQLTDLPDPVDGLFVPGTEHILVEHDEAGNEHTQLSLLDDGRLEPLVSDPASVHRGPHFSADGSLLAYGTNRDNGVDGVVYVRSLRDGRERAIFARGGVCIPAGFSPDESMFVVLHDTGRPSDNDVYLIDLATGDMENVAPHEDESWFDEPV